MMKKVRKDGMVTDFSKPLSLFFIQDALFGRTQ